MLAVEFLAVHRHRPTFAFCITEQHGHQLSASRAHQAGNAQDFTFVEVERNIPRAIAAQIAHTHHHFIGGFRRVLRVIVRQLPADHHADQVLARRVLDQCFAHLLTVAQNHRAVTYFKNFLQAVRNVNHGHTLCFQIPDNVEQDLRLVCRQGCCGLIQN